MCVCVPSHLADLAQSFSRIHLSFSILLDHSTLESLDLQISLDQMGYASQTLEFETRDPDLKPEKPL